MREESRERINLFSVVLSRGRLFGFFWGVSMRRVERHSFTEKICNDRDVCEFFCEKNFKVLWVLWLEVVKKYAGNFSCNLFFYEI